MSKNIYQEQDIYFSTSFSHVLADFNYYLPERVHQFINKVINVISLLIYCLIFSTLYLTFKNN